MVEKVDTAVQQMSWRSERQEWVLGDASGKKQQVVVPETKHEIEIGRLYGVDFLDDGWCAIHSPFDLTARPIPLDAWLDAKALQVNSVGYTVRDALKIVADYEGAHTNELPALLAIAVNPDGHRQGQEHEVPLGQFGVLRMPVEPADRPSSTRRCTLTGRFQEFLAEFRSTCLRAWTPLLWIQ